MLSLHRQYGDFISDLIVCYYLHIIGILWARNYMIGALGLNLFLQVVAVFLFNQPITEIALIFCMLKPAMDMFRMVSFSLRPQRLCDRSVIQWLTIQRHPAHAKI